MSPKMDFKSRIKKMIEEAPVATGGGPRVNYGRLLITPMVITWKGRGQGRPDKATLAEFAAAQGVEVAAAELGDQDQMQLHFDIMVKELNPSLDFDAVGRDVAMLASSYDDKTGKGIKTDWQEIVLPAMEKVFGDDWSDILAEGEGETVDFGYVECEMPESFRMGKDAEGNPKNFGTPKVTASYKNKKACEAARDLRFGKPEDVDKFGPDDEDEETDEEAEEEGFDDAILKQVWTIYNSSKKNDKSTLSLISRNKKLQAFDADDLLAAAKAWGKAQ